MLRFIPIERPGGDRELMRTALLSARKNIQEALGPDAQVGPIANGGFEVVTENPEAEGEIREAVSESLTQESAPGLRMTSKGAIVQDQGPADGSMIGL